MKESVGIIGCGWLGHALAKKLLNDKYRVTVTTQNEEKKQKLCKDGIDAELLSLPVNETEVISLNVFNQKSLIISITPQIRHGRNDYPEKVAQIIEMAELGKVEKVILLSSTAVYNGLTGLVDEQSKLDTNANKVDIITAAEKVARNFTGSTVVLRLAGLVGPERHPGRFLQGKRVLTEPQAFINLIHQDDVVGVLMELIDNESINGTYNAVSATQTNKKDYYAAAASALSLPLPEVSLEASMHIGKRINDAKLRNALNFQFTHDNLIDWLHKSGGRL